MREINLNGESEDGKKRGKVLGEIVNGNEGY